MNFNYHTHTKRCSHASGEDEDYVLTAIENGVLRMGFSDHIPFVFPDGTEAQYRVPMAKAAEYAASVRGLAEKYRDKIELKLGFEAEYYSEHFSTMLDFSRKIGADYLILGQHFIYNSRYSGFPTSRANDDCELLSDYVDSVIEGMASGYFTYVAHPDIFNFVGAKELYVKQIRRLVLESRRLGIPLEINCLGIREGRHYPSELFWRIVGELGAPVTVGFDSHSSAAAYDAASFEVAMKMCRDLSLNYIGEPRLIPLN